LTRPRKIKEKKKKGKNRDKGREASDPNNSSAWCQI
jgi:hypothetical protein